jgi:AhpD family alkylhydroperoxidase
MAILQVYVLADCASCATAHQRLAQEQRLRPHQSIELIDLAQIDAIRPSYIFGTPTYCLDDQVISLGNPSLGALLEVLDAAALEAHEGEE